MMTLAGNGAVEVGDNVTSELLDTAEVLASSASLPLSARATGKIKPSRSI